MLGSIFAAPQYGETPEGLTAEEEVIPRGRPQSRVNTAPETPQGEDVAPRERPQSPVTTARETPLAEGVVPRERPQAPVTAAPETPQEQAVVPGERPQSRATAGSETPRWELRPRTSFVHPIHARVLISGSAPQTPDAPPAIETPKPLSDPPASVIPPLQTSVLTPGGAPHDQDFDPVSEHRPTLEPLAAAARQEEIEKTAVRSADVAKAGGPLKRDAASDHPHPTRERTEQKAVFKSIFKPPHTPASAAGRLAARDLPNRTPTHGQEPEEIRIHIGRIEVTAAPPAPVRAAPKPAHKSLDLGAYLKRRGGRA